MSQIEKARTFAIAAHSAIGQKRKFSGAPYWMHPAGVVNTLRWHKANEDLMVAGWLHDILEDTQVSSATIEVLFGNHVCNLVKSVTKESDLTETHKKVVKMGQDSIMLKIADTIENLRDCCDEVEKNTEFTRKFLAKKKKMLVDWAAAGFDLEKVASNEVHPLYTIKNEMMDLMGTLKQLIATKDEEDAKALTDGDGR